GNPEKRYKSIDSVIKIIKNYLRDYDTHAIRISLAQIILSKNQFIIPEFEKKSRLGVKIASYAATALVVGILALYAWNAGIFHASVLSPWYKPVTLNLITPVAGVQNNIYGLDIPVKAYFFDESDPDLPEVGGSRRDFKNSEGIVTRTKSGKRISASSAQNIKYLTTKPVYLKDGLYRVKILIGSYVMWSTFVMKGDSVNLNFDNLQKSDRQVTVQTRAFDSETGEILTGKTAFTLLYKGKYVLFSQVPPQELVSGKVMKIHADCPGYKTKEFSMIVDWYQDTLFVNAGMEK
ncbi:MAG: hypothetical protein IKP70_03025, partial [Treponema sp.]|nr:hypothetical protein [Treponema sp.]